MRVAFVTCVQLGLSCIEAVYKVNGRFELLITLKDEYAKDKSGRIYLDDISKRYNIPLLKIKNINDPEVIEALKQYKIDWLFIIGWSQIAKRKLLSTPTYGCVGMHPTLLPQGRGRAAIPWAILKGLSQTGVTLFRLDEGVDTGDIIGQGIIKLHDNITAGELYQKVNDMHIELIKRYWPNIMNNHVVLRKQNEDEATEWPQRKAKDGEILASMTMVEADRLVRAVTHPYPGAFYREGNKIIRIWSCNVSVHTGIIPLKDGFLIPTDYEVEVDET